MILLGVQLVSDNEDLNRWQSAYLLSRDRTRTRGGPYWTRNRESSLYKEALLLYNGKQDIFSN